MSSGSVAVQIFPDARRNRRFVAHRRFKLRHLDSAPTMRKVFRLLGAEDSMYKSGQLAPPILLRAKEWPKPRFLLRHLHLKLWAELKIENLVDSTIVQKTNRRALKFYIDYGIK